MKRLFARLIFAAGLSAGLVACSHESSDGDAPATTTAPPSLSASSTPTPAPSASAATTASASPASTAKPTAGAPSSLPFCKASFAAEPLSALCAMGGDWSKAHFECAKPLPRDFCADLSVWGCQYIASAGEKAPRVTFEARFVRPGVALKEGEMIDDNSLRARFPRAGIVRGVTVQTSVTGGDEAAKVIAAQTKKLVDAGCVVGQSDKAGSNRLECGSWQARVRYVDTSTTVDVDADMPKTPDCTK